MNPFFFGASASQLFGAYDAPPGRSTRGVVVCHPLAREYLLAYPTVRHLAQTLADNGAHVLRFDYFGTGDSAGQFSEAGRERWLQDIETAVEELRDMAQVTTVSLVGLRYGAALAAQAAARLRAVDRLVLWDPVFDGDAYLAEMGAPRQLRNGNDLEVQGVVLSESLRRDLEALSAATFSGVPRTLVVSTADTPSAAQPLADHLAKSSAGVTLEHVPDVQVWRQEWGRGGAGMAVEVVKRIAAWLE